MKTYTLILFALLLFSSCGFFQRTVLINHTTENIKVDLYLSSFKKSHFGIRTDSVCLDDSIKVVFQYTGAHSVVGHLKNSIQKEITTVADCQKIRQRINSNHKDHPFGIPLTIVEMNAANEQLILQAELAPNDRLLLGYEIVKTKKDISFDWDQLVINHGTTHTVIHSIEELTNQVDSTHYYRSCADCAATVTNLIFID